MAKGPLMEIFSPACALSSSRGGGLDHSARSRKNLRVFEEPPQLRRFAVADDSAPAIPRKSATPEPARDCNG